MHLIIYGPEGSGKGTQAALLSEKLKVPVITSGDLVRKKATERSKLGALCKSALTQGHYVPDEVMFTLWKELLSKSKSKRGFILDGFPRSISQAEFLLSTFDKLNLKIDQFIYLKLSDEEARIRLLKRKRKLFKGSKISHDTPERINERLKVFREKEAPLVNFFKKKNLVLEFDANKTVNEVFGSIIKKFSKVTNL